jgi:hypothetical protein
MSPTVDETAAAAERHSRDHHAALLFGVLARAVEFAGLPAPRIVVPRDSAASSLHLDTRADVDDWADKLWAATVFEEHVYEGPQGWRKYVARGDLEGVDLEVWCPVEVDENGSPTEPSEPAEHYHASGTAGRPGECAASCACGVTFDGFDTHAEALDALNSHIGSAIGERL